MMRIIRRGILLIFISLLAIQIIAFPCAAKDTPIIVPAPAPTPTEMTMLSGSTPSDMTYSQNDFPPNIRPYIHHADFDPTDAERMGARLYFNGVPEPINGRVANEIAVFLVKSPLWKGSRGASDVADEIICHWFAAAIAAKYPKTAAEFVNHPAIRKLYGTRKNAIYPTHLEYDQHDQNKLLVISFIELGPVLGIFYSADLAPTKTPTKTPTPSSVPTPTITPTPSSESSTDDLGGVNFTSINLNYISANASLIGGATLDCILKGQKALGENPRIDVFNSTLVSTSAFMTGLALPNDKFWVNLNPWEPGRIIDKQLGQTDVGRIMLEADLQMKKDFSGYENPCVNETGKAFWNLLMQKQQALVRECIKKFPGEIRDERNVSFMAMARFWIVPESAYAYHNGTSIYIINSTLTIKSDPIPELSTFILDNPAVSPSKDCSEELNRSAKEYSRYARELEDKMILPYVVNDVNNAEIYNDLRSVYNSLALAQGYKEKIDTKVDVLRNSVDSSNLTALKSVSPWSPEEIWTRYVYSYKNKEYKCWQNKTTNTTFITGNNERAIGTLTESMLIASGGVDFGRIKDNLTLIEGMPLSVQANVDEAISKGYVDEGKNVLFGAKIPAEMIRDAIGSGSSSGSDAPPTFPDSVKPHGHVGEGNATDNETDYYVCSPCPDGWSGPDENCRCWKSECPAGYNGPDENGNCWKSVIVSSD